MIFIQTFSSKIKGKIPYFEYLFKKVSSNPRTHGSSNTTVKSVTSYQLDNSDTGSPSLYRGTTGQKERSDNKSEGDLVT